MSEATEPISDQTGVTFVATRRNGRALCFGGFFYHINKSVDERSYWKCRTKGCKATVVTIKDIIHSSSSQHYHQPNESRVMAAAAEEVTPNGGSTCVKISPKVTVVSKPSVPLSQNQINYLKRQGITDLSNNSFAAKKLKTINNRNTSQNGYHFVSNVSHMRALSVNKRREFDSIEDHLKVEIEVDESGDVNLEDLEDNFDDSDEGSAQSGTQLIPNNIINIKPNNIYYTTSYTNIDNFDIELNNLFEVVRQTGFNSLDIEQISNDWELWKNRYLELKRSQSRNKPSTSQASKDNETLKLQLDIALNAKNNAEKELKRYKNSLKESKNTVSSLRAVLKRNLLNASDSHCISLINEIHDLKRKVSAHVDSHQTNLNDIKRLLSLDDNELRAEFDQLAQERDEALKDNFELKQELIILKSQLSSFEDRSD